MRQCTLLPGFHFPKKKIYHRIAQYLQHNIKMEYTYKGQKDETVPIGVSILLIRPGVPSIRKGACSKCQNSLRWVHFVEDGKKVQNVKSISYWAFHRCILIETFTFPPSLNRLAGNAFSLCRSLLEVDLLNTSVSIINNRTFHKCVSLRAVTLPDGPPMLKICRFAFGCCYSLVTVRVPHHGCTLHIEDLAFSECNRLSNIWLPDDCEVEDQGFLSCAMLASCYVGDVLQGLKNRYLDRPAHQMCYLHSAQELEQQSAILVDGYMKLLDDFHMSPLHVFFSSCGLTKAATNVVMDSLFICQNPTEILRRRDCSKKYATEYLLADLITDSYKDILRVVFEKVCLFLDRSYPGGFVNKLRRAVRQFFRQETTEGFINSHASIYQWIQKIELTERMAILDMAITKGGLKRDLVILRNVSEMLGCKCSRWESHIVEIQP